MSGFSRRQYQASVVGNLNLQVTATIPSTATGVNSFIGSVAVPGVQAGDVIDIAPAVAQTAGVSFGAQVTAANTVAITCQNGSAGTYNPGAQKFNLLVQRLKLA